MTKKQIRIIGGILLVFNIWLVGHYHLTGVVTLILTFGVAAFFELVLVKLIATDTAGKP